MMSRYLKKDTVVPLKDKHSSLPVSGKNVLKVDSSVDIRRCDVTKYTRILGMKYQSSIKDVEEQMNVSRVRKVASHCFEHPCDQPHPHELMKDIQS